MLPAGVKLAAQQLKKTALFDMHVKSQGKMVPFAGWSMPVTYGRVSIGDEVAHTRQYCSLFDVSHMLQFKVSGAQRNEFMERVSLVDLSAAEGGLKLHQSSLTMFINEQGGIVDDAIVNVQQDYLHVVSNAGCADKDLAFMKQHIVNFPKAKLDVIADRSLLALQGPKAASVLEHLTGKSVNDMPFMTSRLMDAQGMKLHVSRSGYTGEDGFELGVSNQDSAKLAKLLLDQDVGDGKKVHWAGLGSRDTLRLEAGLCLYGHDIDETITPIEAALAWTISKRRRAEGGFFGADKVQKQLQQSSTVTRKRVGFVVDGAPAREGYSIMDLSGSKVGHITSGCPSPTLKKNVAMGFVNTGHHKIGTNLHVQVRGKSVPAVVNKMPFVPSRYHKV